MRAADVFRTLRELNGVICNLTPGSRRGLYAFARYASWHSKKRNSAQMAAGPGSNDGQHVPRHTATLQRNRSGKGRASGIRLTRREFVLDSPVAEH